MVALLCAKSMSYYLAHRQNMKVGKFIAVENKFVEVACVFRREDQFSSGSR